MPQVEIDPRIATPADLAITATEGRWIPYAHLCLLNEYLVKLYTGEITRLVVSMPPQHGKSSLISKWFACWWLGWNPEDRISIASHTADLAEEFGGDNRQFFENFGSELFGLEIDKRTNSRGKWRLKGHRGGMRSVGVGGGFHGHPIDLGIIDDPTKGRAQAESSAARQKIKTWYKNDFLSRLSKNARVIIVQTRWHEDDLTGHVLQSAEENGEVWVTLNLPAIAFSRDEIPEEEHEECFPDPLGRQPGEALCPELHPLEQLHAQRKEMDDGPDWWSIYQGRPRPGRGGIFDEKHWSYWADAQFLLRYDPDKKAYYYPMADHKYDEIIQSWDCAWKDTSRSDFVVCGVWARRGADIFLLMVLRRRMNVDDTCEAMKEMKRMFPMTAEFLVEGKAKGPEVVKRLKSAIPSMKLLDPKGTKVERAEAVRHRISSGNVHIPNRKSRHAKGWVRPYVVEMAAFPFGTHDDQVDMTTQYLQFIDDRAGSSTEGMKTAPRKNGLKAALRRNVA